MPAALPPNYSPPYPLRLHPRVLAGFGSLLGALMVAVGIGWALLAGDEGPGAWFPRERWLADLLLGALLGAGFAAGAWGLFGRIPALRRIERRLVAVLDVAALRPHHAIIFGLLAGVPEEILFRGALQPTLGLLVASLVFGALHAVTLAYFVYAGVAGMLLGALALWRGALWAPIAAHTVIDVIMFALLIRRWRTGARAQGGCSATPGEE
ncbi:MAG: type II CAAX endopeptidase family protein [Chloroflexota bacterium]